MTKAVKAVRNKEFGYRVASKTFDVPLTTLKTYVHQANDEGLDKDAAVDVSALGRTTALGSELEEELYKYCVAMEEVYFGLRRRDIRRMAFELAMKNNLAHSFSKKTGCAGRKWLRGFLKTHPQLSLRRPQRISVARAKSFTEENIGQFFENLKPELEKVKFKPSRIFNCDETGITVVQHSTEKVITLKGRREVHKLSSAESGGLITVVLCMSASGIFVEPMVIFSRKRRCEALGNDLPPESVLGFSPIGWITSELFTQWFSHFIKKIHPTEENPALLILDGHFSHTRNLDVIELPRKNHVSLLSLPPHTSGKTQPLNVSFMKTFKSYYSTNIETWMDMNEGRVLNHFSIGKLFTAAYNQSATILVASKGFQRAGIYPLNSRIHEDDPKLIKSKKNNDSRAQPDSPVAQSVPPSTPTLTDDEDEPAIISENPIPSTSSAFHVNLTHTHMETPQTPVSSHTAAKKVSPTDIRPVPRLTGAVSTSRSKDSVLISASPYKKSLEAAEQKKQEKIEAQARKLEHQQKKQQKEAALQKKKEQQKKPNVKKKLN